MPHQTASFLGFSRVRCAFVLLMFSALGFAACQRSNSQPPPILFQSTSSGSGSQGPVSPFENAKNLHFQGVQGNAEAHEKAFTQLQALHAQQPGNAKVKAYLGSNRLIAARDHWWPPTKGELATQGTVLLDAAVEAAPDDLEVRFLRGTSTVNLPKQGGRYDIAVTDLQYVADRAVDAVEHDMLEVRFAVAACLQYADVLESRGEADAARRYRQAAHALQQEASPTTTPLASAG